MPERGEHLLRRRRARTTRIAAYDKSMALAWRGRPVALLNRGHREEGARQARTRRWRTSKRRWLDATKLAPAEMSRALHADPISDGLGPVLDVLGKLVSTMADAFSRYKRAFAQARLGNLAGAAEASARGAGAGARALQGSPDQRSVQADARGSGLQRSFQIGTLRGSLPHASPTAARSLTLPGQAVAVREQRRVAGVAHVDRVWTCDMSRGHEKDSLPVGLTAPKSTSATPVPSVPGSQAATTASAASSTSPRISGRPREQHDHHRLAAALGGVDQRQVVLWPSSSSARSPLPSA